MTPATAPRIAPTHSTSKTALDVFITSQEFSDIANRYATDAIRTRILRELSDESGP